MQLGTFLIAVATSVVCCACSVVPAINTKEAEIHYQAAHNYEMQRDFVSARDQYWKALVAARSAGAAPATISMLTYEFGRSTGYTCHIEESENALLTSLQMEEGFPQRNGRNIGIRLFELARLTYDQKRFKDAASYYARALLEVERNDGVKSDPIAFARIYEEYGDALLQTGQDGAAQEALQRARILREANPNLKAKFIPVRYKCP
jgi:tetratricopeptide (TPR) repeat protein